MACDSRCQTSISQKVSLRHVECTICWQVLTLVPLEDIREVLEAYFHLRFNDKQLEEHLKDHYDTEVYGLGYVSYFILLWNPCSTMLDSIKSIKCYRKDLGLLSTRQQKHTSESIASAVAEIHEMFPSCGRETIRKELSMWYGIRASRWAQPSAFLMDIWSSHILKCHSFRTSWGNGAGRYEKTSCAPFPLLKVPCCWCQWCLGSRPAW